MGIRFRGSLPKTFHCIYFCSLYQFWTICLSLKSVLLLSIREQLEHFCLLETQSIDNQNASRKENELTAGMRDSNWICLNALSSGSRLLLDLRTWSFPEFMNMTKNIVLLCLSVMCLKMMDRLFDKILTICLVFL